MRSRRGQSASSISQSISNYLHSRSGRSSFLTGGDLTNLQYATQGLSRKDRRHLQCHQECCRCYHLQAGGEPVHREAGKRQSRTRFTVAIKRGVPSTSQGQCCKAEEGKDGGYTYFSQETTSHAKGSTNDRRKGQRTGDHHSNPLRDNHLEWSRWVGVLLLGRKISVYGGLDTTFVGATRS